MSHVRATLLLAAVGSTAVSAAAQDVQVFFGNLHSHTSFSDGTGIPEDAYRHARDVAGLDFLAVTEHNHAAAPSRIATDPSLYNGATSISLIQTANRFDEPGRFVAIFGQEYSSIGSGNHGNVFEVPNVIDVDNGAWRELLDTWIPNNLDSSNQQALILLNHPNASDSRQSEEYGRDDFNNDVDLWRTTLDSRAQLINLINGPSHSGSEPGRPSENEYRRYLDLGFHLGPTADQDNHRADWGSAAETRTGVLATELSKPAIMSALRARHVYATQDRNLRLIARVNGELIGSRISGGAVPSPGSEFAFELDIEDEDEPLSGYIIDVFMDEIGGSDDADIVESFEATGNGAFTLGGLVYPGGNTYAFLRITQSTDDVVEGDRAWTAPIWFEPAGTPSPPAPAISVSLVVDVAAETAEITNLGTIAVDMTDWQLVSTVGNQSFTFPAAFSLAPGAMVTVTSGSNAEDDPPEFLRWTGASIWRNSGDPGVLLNGTGDVMAGDP